MSASAGSVCSRSSFTTLFGFSGVAPSAFESSYTRLLSSRPPTI